MSVLRKQMPLRIYGLGYCYNDGYSTGRGYCFLDGSSFGIDNEYRRYDGSVVGFNVLYSSEDYYSSYDNLYQLLDVSE